MANKKKSLMQYGICTNKGKCELADTKQRQEIPLGKPFVCQNPDCGKQLLKVAPPKEKKNGALIWGCIVGGVAVVAALLWFCVFDKQEEPVVDEPQVVEQVIDPAEPETLPVDTPEVVTPAEPEPEAEAVEEVTEPTPEPVAEPAPKPAPVAKPKPAFNVPFGVYSGPADGLNGEIKVTKSYSLDLRNAAHETLDLLPGDMITRTKFKDGELVSGYWQRGTQARSFHR